MGWSRCINGSGDCQVVAQAADGMTTVELALKTQPDVVVVDISMPKLNGIEVVRRLTKELESTRILVLTMHAEEEYVMHVVRAGAAGFPAQGQRECRDARRRARARGRPRLLRHARIESAGATGAEAACATRRSVSRPDFARARSVPSHRRRHDDEGNRAASSAPARRPPKTIASACSTSSARATPPS